MNNLVIKRIDTEKSILTPPQTAALIQVSLRWLADRRKRGGGPAHVTVGGLYRYRREDIDAFMAMNVKQASAPQRRARTAQDLREPNEGAANVQ